MFKKEGFSLPEGTQIFQERWKQRTLINDGTPAGAAGTLRNERVNKEEPAEVEKQRGANQAASRRPSRREPRGPLKRMQLDPLTRIRVSWNSGSDSPPDTLGANGAAQLNELRSPMSCSCQRTRHHSPSTLKSAGEVTERRVRRVDTQPSDAPKPPPNTRGSPDFNERRHSLESSARF